MNDDVKQSSADRYAVSQAYRWRAERDQARQELRQLKEEVEGRLMPEGMEWPRYESGELVKFGDELEHKEDGNRFKVDVVEFTADGWRACSEMDAVRDVYRPGERVKRPAKVLDADGVEIEVGDDLYSVEGGLKLHVGCIDTRNGKIATAEMYALDKWTDPAMYTHRAPVLAADGKLLREGETVWRVKDGSGPYHVQEIRDGASVCVGETWREFRPKELTHERPEIDRWERLEEDAGKDPCSYFGFDGEETCGKCPASGKNCEQTMARDLVRRAKKLAGGA